jgi:hypothetical protein
MTKKLRSHRMGYGTVAIKGAGKGLRQLQRDQIKAYDRMKKVDEAR